ncbi:hypothetical protein WJX82_010798 [Trebouxia sp. C0006]
MWMSTFEQMNRGLALLLHLLDAPEGTPAFTICLPGGGVRGRSNTDASQGAEVFTFRYSIKQMFLNLQDTCALLVEMENKSKGELTYTQNA